MGRISAKDDVVEWDQTWSILWAGSGHVQCEQLLCLL